MEATERAAARNPAEWTGARILAEGIETHPGDPLRGEWS
jgi:hypothetical protein